jgi:hypothetical protein
VKTVQHCNTLLNQMAEGYVLFTKHYRETEKGPQKLQITLQKGTVEKSVVPSLFHSLCEHGQITKTTRCALGITYYAVAS